MHGCTETIYVSDNDSNNLILSSCPQTLFFPSQVVSLFLFSTTATESQPHRGGLTGFLVQYIEHYDSPSVWNQAQRVCPSCKSSISTVSHHCGLKVSLLRLLKASCVQPCAACLLIQHFNGVTWIEGLLNCCNSLYSTVFSAYLNILSCQSQHRRWPWAPGSWLWWGGHFQRPSGGSL